MALAHCARCGNPLVAVGMACARCGTARRVRVRVRKSKRPRGLAAPPPVMLSLVVRRLFICLVVALAGGTWLAVATYAQAHRTPESADVKATQCAMIEDVGEDYYGELAMCRNHLARLRAAERR